MLTNKAISTEMGSYRKVTKQAPYHATRIVASEAISGTVLESGRDRAFSYVVRASDYLPPLICISPSKPTLPTVTSKSLPIINPTISPIGQPQIPIPWEMQASSLHRPRYSIPIGNHQHREIHYPGRQSRAIYSTIISTVRLS